jgi:hypothetical protein
MQEEFNLLRNKEIIAILDGDTKYEDITFDDDSFCQDSYAVS